MAEKPLLAMPRPERRTPTATGQFPREVVSEAKIGRQGIRLGPKFQRLEDTLNDPRMLKELREDAAAIVPERALVFEVASKVVDFYQAVRGIPGLEFLGEDEVDNESPDEDFYIIDDKRQSKTDKLVPRRFYFTIPDQGALKELVSLWKRYQKGAPLNRGQKAWKKVFGHLADIRPWGPKDRLTDDAIKDWHDLLQSETSELIRFEVEFWYRESLERRQKSNAEIKKLIEDQGGQLLHHVAIDQIRYHAVLTELPPAAIHHLLDYSEVGLVTFDDIMFLRPQSLISSPVEESLEHTTENETQMVDKDTAPPIVALLDGVPMAQHARLKNRLVVDDPDEYGERYSRAIEQRHATAMASLILHGDLNMPDQATSVRRQLYVRPVMYPQKISHDSSEERMPPDRLVIDVIWRAFIRMFDGENGEPPTAPDVRVVNLSLGDANRRFAGVMSPWARLIDYLAWNYSVLILVSSGNILDRIPLGGYKSLVDLENADGSERQTAVLRAVLQQRAKRQLLSPSEAINALTVGAAHMNNMELNSHSANAFDPYTNSFLPNTSSALGLGFRKSVKPEILMPGGVELLRADKTHKQIEVVPVGRPLYFGIGVASPGTRGETNKQSNMSGTSVATALATHGVLSILQTLEEMPNDPVYPIIESAYHAVILKALLVHSARWNETAVDALKPLIHENKKVHPQHERDEISRFLGFGSVDITRVIDCTENRATLIGWNQIHARETDRFKVPLPTELEGVKGFRTLSVTIAWLTPTTLSHQMYRLAKFKVASGGEKGYSLKIDNSKNQPFHNALGKGTIYHHRWEGTEAAEFVDDGSLIIDVTCSPTTGKMDESIRYAVVASLEVGTEVAIPVYELIRKQLRESVPIVAS